MFMKTQVITENDLAGEDKTVTVWRLSVITDGESRYRRYIDSERVRRGFIAKQRFVRGVFYHQRSIIVLV